MASAPLAEDFASDAYPGVVAAASAVLAMGPADRVRLETVALRLLAEGIASDDPRVPLWFAAALCRSAGERRAFLAACGVKIDVDVIDPTTKNDTTKSDEIAADTYLKKHWRRLASAVTALVVMVALVVLAAIYLPPPPDDNKVEVPNSVAQWPVQKQITVPRQKTIEVIDWITIAILAALVLAAIGYLVWRQRWLHDLKQRFAPDPDKAVPLALRHDETRLFASQAIRAGLRRLRRHRSQPGGRLDVRASIVATIHAGGQPQARFRGRLLMPEYLLLSEREAPRDHLAMAGCALAQRIAQENVAIGHYEFLGRPDRLRAASGERASTPLASVLARHADARTMLLAEGFDLRSGALTPAWVERVTDAGPTVHLNPRLTGGRAEGEGLLAEDGIDSFPLSARGIAAMAQRLADPRGRTSLLASGATHADLARDLDGERKLLLAEEAPRAMIVEGVVQDLEAWLDPQAYRWFAALALFPYLEPALTLYLGSHLKDADGAPVLTDERYLAIARLPWARAGVMPRWLRLALAHTLDRETLASATAAIQAFLLPTVEGGEASEIAIESGRDPARRRLLLAWLSASPESEFHDPILIDTIKGRPAHRLGLRPTERLARRLRAWRHNPRLIALAVLIAAGALVLLVRPPLDEAIRNTGESEVITYDTTGEVPVDAAANQSLNEAVNQMIANNAELFGSGDGNARSSSGNQVKPSDFGDDGDVTVNELDDVNDHSDAGLKAQQDRMFATLAPEMQGPAARLMEAARAKGIHLFVVEAFRTTMRQEELYARGRTTPGPIITNARGPTAHTLTLAFDVFPVVNGKIAYDRIDLLRVVGALAKDIGLVWGGNWTVPDYAHFETPDAQSRVKAAAAARSPEETVK